MEELSNESSEEIIIDIHHPNLRKKKKIEEQEIKEYKIEEQKEKRQLTMIKRKKKKTEIKNENEIEGKFGLNKIQKI